MVGKNYIGCVLDKKYKVSRLLGENGMGVVYVGEDISNCSRVAIKILRSSPETKQESIKRFFREARAAVELRQRNIIRVFDVGLSDEEDPYIIQEYLEGESLADLLLRVGKLKPIPALGIIEPVVRAVGAMHGKGILHRGITPENIYLVHQPGKPPAVKLIDFGLAKFTDGSETSNLTMVGIPLGDFAYISPEQIRDSSAVDRRSDLYTIGTIMYELLTGELPYSDIPHDRRLTAKMTTGPTPPKDLVRGIPAALDALILRAMSVKPDGRPASADEMLNTLETLSGYGSRESKLVKCAQGAHHLTIAGGVFDPSAAADAAGCSEDLRHRQKKKGPIKARRPLIDTVYGRIVGAVAAIGVIVAVVIAVSDDEDNKKVPRPSPQSPSAAEVVPPPKEVKPTDVQIEVRGLPMGAKIYYNEAPIPVNPFRVGLQEVIVPLKIEADGYPAYVTSVVPAEDQVVKVQMKKIESSADSEDTDDGAASVGAVKSESQVEDVSQRAPQTERAHAAQKRGSNSIKREQKGESSFQKIKKDLKVSKEFD